MASPASSSSISNLPGPPQFRIDVAIHDLLMNSSSRPPTPPEPRNLTLPEPVFPQHPELLKDPGPEFPPERRRWSRKDIYRAMRGWLFPYVKSRILPGEFHPIHLLPLLGVQVQLGLLVLLGLQQQGQGYD